MAVPGTARMPWCPDSARRSRNTRWSTKMLGSSPSMTLRWNSSGIEEARRSGARHDGAGADRLDVAHGAGQLAVDLRPDERRQLAVGQLVHHRVPDRPAVLQPVQVDRAVGAQRVEVGGAAVVLVDEADVAVADDERRVATGTVGDARLDVDRHGQPAEVELLAVGRADQVREAEPAHRAGRARASGSPAAARRCRAAGGRAARARPSGHRAGGRRRGSRRPRCGPAGRRRGGRCGGTGTRRRGRPGRTTGRTRSSRGRTR